MSHRLDRLELEIKTADEALARPLLERLSRLHHQALQDVLARVLDQLSPAGAVHRLERLELDLGEIPPDRLERELPLRLERALREALPARLPEALVREAPPPVDPAGAADDPTVARQLELLASYASSGQLPWWAPRDDPRQIPAALEEALAIAREVPAAERASWWRTLAPNGIARERLLAAAEAAQRPGLRQALLEGLLPDSQTAGLPKPRAVVANAERQEAAEEANRERLEAAEEANRDRLETTEAANADRLEAFQTPLEQAAPMGDGSPPVDGAAAADDPTVARQLELLASYASSGQLPWWAPRDDPRQIPAALEEALAIAREVPAAERASWWRTLAPNGIARERLLAAAEAAQRPGLRQALLEGLLPDSQTAGLPKPRAVVANAERQEAAEEANRERLEAAEEANRDRLETTEAANADRLDEAERANRERLEAAERANAERQEAAEGPLPVREPPRPSDPASAAPGSSQPRRGAQGAVDRLELLGLPIVTARAAAPSLEEPLTVDGAGLVLLWPFLETLLSRLAWLTPERAFLGAAEQQRAVALLGCLVEGDPRPPEWRLTLAKLLCGVALEEVCAPEEPLEEAEVAEAEALLRAVLAHGEGLLGKANEELRHEWLRRPGLLSWRPGAWLLVVEQREGDDALEQLPWRWDWIRLPWMEELLQVVW